MSPLSGLSFLFQVLRVRRWRLCHRGRPGRRETVQGRGSSLLRGGWWVMEGLWEQFMKGIKLSLILGMDWKIGNVGQSLIVEWFVVLYFDVWLLTQTQWQMQWKLLWLCVWIPFNLSILQLNSPSKHINVCFIKFSLVHCYVVILNTFVSINSFIVFRQNLWCFVYDCCVMLHYRGREGLQKVWNWTRGESLRCIMIITYHIKYQVQIIQPSTLNTFSLIYIF